MTIISTNKKHIDKCYRLRKTESNNKIVRFVNIRFCTQILDKIFDLSKMDFSSKGFGSNSKTFVKIKNYHGREGS